jgi:hypothetical protein
MGPVLAIPAGQEAGNIDRVDYDPVHEQNANIRNGTYSQSNGNTSIDADDTNNANYLADYNHLGSGSAGSLLDFGYAEQLFANGANDFSNFNHVSLGGFVRVVYGWG